MARADSTVVGGVDAGDAVAPVTHRLLESHAPTKGTDVERLIGDYPSRWLTLASVWLALAFSVGFGLWVNYQAQGREVSFGFALMAVIPHYFFWALVSPALYRALHRTISGANRILWIANLVAWSVIALAGSTAMSFLSYFLRRGLTPDLEQFVSIFILPPAGPAFWAKNFSILLLALTAFAALRWRRLRDQAQWSSAQTELRGAKLEAQLAITRLQVLQAQIHPHFVLNSLNAIAGLVQIGERDRAFDAIGRLGELLQVALRNGTDINMTLGEEIDFLQRYLKLCELRFESQFHYSVSVPDALRTRRMPALIVQPLIENALRHGMQPPRPLTVNLRAYECDGSIVIEVEDDGNGISEECAEILRAGHGLANVAERLQLFFGDAASLRLEPLASRGTRATITCPS